MSDDDDSAGLDPAPRRGGGRRQGIPNYNKKIIIPIIKEILPNGPEAWCLVAVTRKEQSGKKNLWSKDDLKHNWISKLCNNMKKPTGSTGENGDRVCKCISIEKKIMRKTHSGFLGDSSAEGDYMPSPSGSDAKRRAKKMKRCATLEQLSDHGGKAGGGGSSSRCSDDSSSKEDSNSNDSAH